MDIPASTREESATTTDEEILNSLTEASLNGNQSVSNDWSIVPNKTLDTNDKSVVGDLAHKDVPDTPSPNLGEFQPIINQTPDSTEPLAQQPPVADVTPTSLAMPEIIDPDKEKFIKTYTEEFDLVIVHATDVVDKILAAIDSTVREHLPNIAIPREIDEFVDTPPSDYKVEKFDDAQDIVKAVMAKANEAKQQSAAAANEAAKVYDGVQQFKQQTREEIKTLTNGMDLDDIKKRDEEEKQQGARSHNMINPTVRADDHDKHSFVSSFIKDNAAKSNPAEN